MQSCTKPLETTGMMMGGFFVNLSFVPQKGGLIFVFLFILEVIWTFNFKIIETIKLHYTCKDIPVVCQSVFVPSGFA